MIQKDIKNKYKQSYQTYNTMLPWCANICTILNQAETYLFSHLKKKKKDNHKFFSQLLQFKQLFIKNLTIHTDYNISFYLHED